MATRTRRAILPRHRPAWLVESPNAPRQHRRAGCSAADLWPPPPPRRSRPHRRTRRRFLLTRLGRASGKRWSSTGASVNELAHLGHRPIAPFARSGTFAPTLQNGHSAINAMLRPFTMRVQEMNLAAILSAVRSRFNPCKLVEQISRSGHHFAHHPPMHIRQPEIAARIAIGEPLVIEAEQPQDRRLQIVDVDLRLDRLEAERVGRADGPWPPLTPPPASHIVKPQWLWSRPLMRPALAPGVGSSTVGVRPNSPPQMTSVSSSMPRCFRSLQQGADGLIALPGQPAMVDFDVVVVVPRLALRRARPGRSARLFRAAGGRSGSAGPARRGRTCRGCVAARG